MPIPSQPTEPEPIPSAFYKVVARLYHVEYDTDVYLFAMFRKDKDTGLRHFVPVEQFWGRPMLSLPSVVEAFAPISPNVWGIIPISELDSVKIYESALGEVQDNHVH